MRPNQVDQATIRNKAAITTSSSERMLTRTPSSANSKRHLLAEPKSRAKLKQVLVVAFLLIGLIVCVTSLICILMLPSFVANQISKRLVLKNNSMLLERWSKPNVPMYFKVWVFDVTNAHEVALKRDTKPQLKEIGPFVFHLKRQKDIVSFAGDNLYYTERKVYHFSPELSCCSINTTVTVPNIPLVAVVDRALGYNLPLVGRFIPRLINRAIQSLREQLFVRKQVRELLFDGYEVELLKMVSRVGAIVGLPQTNQKFGLLKGRNDTWRPEQDGVWAINTGISDRRQFGKVSSWNSYKKLPFWAAPGCNAINGSDGTLFPPPIKTSEPLYIFNQELCRTVNLVYDGPSDIRGIKALKFVLNPMNFAHTMSGSNDFKANSHKKPTSDGQSSVTSLLPEGANSIVNPPVKLDAQSVGKHTPTLISSEISAPLREQQNPHMLNIQQPIANLVNDDHDNNQSNDLTPNGKRWRLASTSPNGPQGAASRVGVSATGLTPPATRAEQEKFVLAAQEAQAQADRRPSQRNPFTCFCDRKSTNLNGINVCEFDGLIDLSKCTKQAQVIFGSMPHFYRSDLRLARQVGGMEPNASKHTTFLDIEPNTGLVLGGKRRVQLNLLMKHNNEVDGFENINDMLLPLVWFEESAMIPEESAKKFKSLYINRIRMINLVLISMLLASIGLIAIDLRLLLASGHWREFKLVKMAAASCNQVGQVNKRNTGKNGGHLTRQAAATSGFPQLVPIKGGSPIKDSFSTTATSTTTTTFEDHQLDVAIGRAESSSVDSFGTAHRKESTISNSSNSSSDDNEHVNDGKLNANNNPCPAIGDGILVGGSTSRNGASEGGNNSPNGQLNLPLLANYEQSNANNNNLNSTTDTTYTRRQGKSIVEINRPPTTATKTRE